MEKIVKKIAKLIDLKSIITLILTIALVIGFFNDKIAGEKLSEFVLLVLTFYFAKQEKKEETEETPEQVEEPVIEEEKHERHSHSNHR